MGQARVIHVNEPRQQMKNQAKREQEITGMSPIMSRFGSVSSDGHGECCEASAVLMLNEVHGNSRPRSPVMKDWFLKENCIIIYSPTCNFKPI